MLDQGAAGRREESAQLLIIVNHQWYGTLLGNVGMQIYKGMEEAMIKPCSLITLWHLA